jgi:hypothetical protein
MPLNTISHFLVLRFATLLNWSKSWLESDCVSEQENVDLIRPFLEEEIRKALFQMKRNKAARPDGFPIEFYQKCWGFIKDDMLNMFRGFYMGDLDIKRINYGIITLLPKVKNVEKIQQYRPICLLNCLYKWFTKTLTLKLEGVAGRIVHRTQSAFIGGRNIMNNILALHETKRKGDIGVVLKLDF